MSDELMVVPDFYGALTGWRKFGTCDQGKVLTSAGVEAPWLSAYPGPAICVLETGLRPTHWVDSHPLDEPCPAYHCSCGYYAYRSQQDAEHHQQGHVLGHVEMWGRIVQHERGYRAEHMRVKELYLLDPAGEGAAESIAWDNVAALQARYQVPVHRVKGRGVWISESVNALSSLNPSLNIQVSGGSLTFSRNLTWPQSQFPATPAGVHQSRYLAHMGYFLTPDEIAAQLVTERGEAAQLVDERAIKTKLKRARKAIRRVLRRLSPVTAFNEGIDA
jgi:hypothetical protein